MVGAGRGKDEWEKEGGREQLLAVGEEGRVGVKGIEEGSRGKSGGKMRRVEERVERGGKGGVVEGRGREVGGGKGGGGGEEGYYMRGRGRVA